MKDTALPLYIIFVGEDKTVIDVKTGVPNSEDYITCVSSENKIAYVIELTTNNRNGFRHRYSMAWRKKSSYGLPSGSHVG